MWVFAREKCLISDLLFISTIKGIACLTFITVNYERSAEIVSSLRSAANSVSITGPAPSLLNYKRKKCPHLCSRLEFMEKCRSLGLERCHVLQLSGTARMIYNRIGRLSCRQSEKLEKSGDGAEQKFFHSSDPYHEWRKGVSWITSISSVAQ